MSYKCPDLVFSLKDRSREDCVRILHGLHEYLSDRGNMLSENEPADKLRQRGGASTYHIEGNTVLVGIVPRPIKPLALNGYYDVQVIVEGQSKLNLVEELRTKVFSDTLSH